MTNLERRFTETPQRMIGNSDAFQWGFVRMVLASLLSLLVGCFDDVPTIQTAPAPTAAQIAPVALEKPQVAPEKTQQKSIQTTRATLIPKVILKDRDGKVRYVGEIDLQPTLDRIANGERNQHRNDGTVFRNREGHLPPKPSGYYHEYVVPTPNVRGPGSQRLILGEAGEVYYTSDHYNTFRKIAVQFKASKTSP